MEEKPKAKEITPAQFSTLNDTVYIKAVEVASIMQCSLATANKCIKKINDRRKEQGLFVIAGRCPRAEFYKEICIAPPTSPAGSGAL